METNNKKILLGLLFIVFLFLRLFVSSPAILLAADHLKFLENAKRFPYHTLYNNQLYLLHPPFYPYVIHLLNYIFNDYPLTGILLSLVSSIIIFFLLYNLFMYLTRDFSLTFLTLAFYTLSVGLIKVSSSILREPFAIMLILATLYFYVKGLKSYNRKYFILSSLFGIASAATSDYVVLLLGALALSYILLNRKKIELRRFYFPNLMYALLPILATIIVYSLWLGVKAYTYSNNQYYPIGFEGTPMEIRNVGLLQLISPQNFDDFDYALPSLPFEGLMPAVKRFVFNAGYLFNMEPFSIPQGLNFTTMHYLLRPHHIIYMVFLYLPLSIIAIIGFLYIIGNSLKTKKIHNNVHLYILGLFLIFAFPITQKYAGPRYIYTAYLFFFYFIALGIILVSKRIFNLSVSKLIVIFSLLLILLIPSWYINHKNFVISGKIVYSGQNTANYIRANVPEDAGIMAQPGSTVKLIYLTGNRVLSLYPKPEDLQKLINYYNISYIVFSRYYTWDRYHFSRESIDYVISNPDKFKLIATIKEDYSAFYGKENPSSSDEVYIYKVAGLNENI